MKFYDEASSSTTRKSNCFVDSVALCSNQKIFVMPQRDRINRTVGFSSSVDNVFKEYKKFQLQNS